MRPSQTEWMKQSKQRTCCLMYRDLLPPSKQGDLTPVRQLSRHKAVPLPIYSHYTQTELDKGENNSGVKFAPVCLPRLRTASVCATRAKRGVRSLFATTHDQTHPPPKLQPSIVRCPLRPTNSSLVYFTGNECPKRNKKTAASRSLHAHGQKKGI